LVDFPQLQVCDIAFDMRIAPSIEQEVRALLVHYARVGLQKCAGSQSDAVQHRVILEAAGDEGADAAAVEQVIHEERPLPQAADVLVLVAIAPLHARESAGLHIAPTVHETDVELTFFTARVVHILALRLDCVRSVSAEWGEELAAAAEGEVTLTPRAEG